MVGNKKVLLASLDIYRPAAQEQLISLGQNNNIPTLEFQKDKTPLQIAARTTKDPLNMQCASRFFCPSVSPECKKCYTCPRAIVIA